MRGEKRCSPLMSLSPSRITPACAGKSSRLLYSDFLAGDHPRMRGEKGELTGNKPHVLGSPPHARGKVLDQIRLVEPRRITPACAGKRLIGEVFTPLSEDHPRMRGEKMPSPAVTSCGPGSPPHARGKAFVLVLDQIRLGITPACAGKRTAIIPTSTASADHPRMRGEKVFAPFFPALLTGSPPHARGKERQTTVHMLIRRITPACAGKRASGKRHTTIYRDHPRMRGEKVTFSGVVYHYIGSPPHARGKASSDSIVGSPNGITPACAGKRRLKPRR